MTREGNIFTTEFSENGEDYTVARFFTIDMPTVIKVGITTQSTVGEGTDATIKYFEIA
jgi:regulation of enolase protein 1 (concanavalin A-like superfamily)